MTFDPEAMNRMNAEWEGWQKVIAALNLLGFTNEQINEGTGNLQILIDAICVWGELLVALRVNQTEEERAKILADAMLKYDNG